MAGKTKTNINVNVPSPFCGIGTDDLRIRVHDNELKVVENGCAVNTPLFEQALTDLKPMIKGKVSTLEKAVEIASSILKKADLPLIGGMATDVDGVREALSVADHCGAVVDSMSSPAAMRNILALQHSGWMNTTLAEVKNRADLIVVLGTDLETLFPRFFDRFVWNKESMFIDDTSNRNVIYLGKAPSGNAAKSPDGRPPQVLQCNDEDLPAVVSTLRALLHDRMIKARSVGGIAIDELRQLAEKLLKAKYGVITWAAAALDFQHAELTVQMTCEMIKDINDTTRCSGLPLGGKEGDQTANQVCGWITGYPVRTRFSKGYPEYDPYLNATDRLLADREVDALLWVSAFNVERIPPKTSIPKVVIGRSGMSFEKAPDVFIPVGVPGIDHKGHAYRTDNVVAIRLRKLRDSKLPSTAQVLSAIDQAL